MPKNIITVVLLCFVSHTCFAQLTIPINKGQQGGGVIGKNALVVPLGQDRLDSVRKILRNTAISKNGKLQRLSTNDGAVVGDAKYENLSRGDKHDVDSAIKDSLEIYADKYTQQIVDSLNKHTSRFQVIASGGVVGTSDQLKTAIGSLSVGLLWRITPFKKGADNWVDPHYIYVAWGASTARSADSNSVLKALIFPEITKRDFVLGYYWEKSKNGFTWGPLFEASLCKYEDTANRKIFRSESFLGGIKASFSAPIQNLSTTAGLQFFLYYNLINIDPKYNTDYYAITKNIPIHNTFHIIGLNTQAQIDRVTLFCNAKYIMNSHKDVASPDLMRFVYTLGTLIIL